MKILVLAGLLISLASPATSSPESAERIPVAIRMVGDDGLTQKLSAGLKTALQNDTTLRLAKKEDLDVVSIESDSNVGWDELNGKTVLIYTVYVFRDHNRGSPQTGICYESRISKCVNAIVRLARIEAERSYSIS